MQAETFLHSAAYLHHEDVTMMHSHDFYEFFLVTKGPIWHLINGEKELLRNNTLRFIRPDDRHTFDGEAGASNVCYNMAFSSAYFRRNKQLFPFCNIEESINPQVLLPETLSRSLALKFQYLVDEESRINQIARQGIITSLFADAMSCLAGLGAQVAERPPVWLVQVCDEMRKPDNLAKGLERFVKISGYTQEYLSRCLRRYFNTSPTAYINSLRLNEAARLLRQSNLDILGVQYEVGFENTSHFNVLFKKEFCLTPSQYRRQSRGG
jgi:AraC family cel operon transcriptional repressor